ncbi:MAG: phosphatase PAP2 family protein [Candidatus Nanohalobium sp.]
MLARHPLITEPMLAVTMLGSLTFAVITVTALYSARKKELAGETLLGLLIANSIVYISKVLVSRPRPEHILPEVARYSTTSSFPSGHTATAFLLAGSLSSQISRRTAYTMASLVGISRIYLGAHFPSDVVAGAAIGILTGRLVDYRKLFETISSTSS